MSAVVRNDPVPWVLVGDEVLDARGDTVITIDEDQQELWEFIVAAVNAFAKPRPA